MSKIPNVKNKQKKELSANNSLVNGSPSPSSRKETISNIKAPKKLKKTVKNKNALSSQNIDISDNINLNNFSNNGNSIDTSLNSKLAVSENKTDKIKYYLNTKSYKSDAQIINELPKNEVEENKITYKTYKILFVFRNEDFSINIKENKKILDLRKKIANVLLLDVNQLILSFQNKEIKEESNDFTIKDFFGFPKNKSRPLLFVKLKNKYNYITTCEDKSDKNYIKFTLSYDNKVKITNYPSLTDKNVQIEDDIFNVIKNFCKENSLNSDFRCEKQITNDNSNIYIIGFTTPDIAFDFNRYMNSLRLLNPIFKDIKIQVLLKNRRKRKDFLSFDDRKNEQNNEKKYNYNYNYRYGLFLNYDEKDLEKRNMEIINIVKNKFLKNKSKIMQNNYDYKFLSISDPYVDVHEESKKIKLENRKKWLSPEGFITSVDKYSGIQI